MLEEKNSWKVHGLSTMTFVLKGWLVIDGFADIHSYDSLSTLRLHFMRPTIFNILRPPHRLALELSIYGAFRWVLYPLFWVS